MGPGVGTTNTRGVESGDEMPKQRVAVASVLAATTLVVHTRDASTTSHIVREESIPFIAARVNLSNDARETAVVFPLFTSANRSEGTALEV